MTTETVETQLESGVWISKEEPKAYPPGCCPDCGLAYSAKAIQVAQQGEGETCVGYFSPPGHDHDDNCRKRQYTCPNGHKNTFSIRRKCPAEGCGWRGKEDCFCCKNPKVDCWPEEAAS